MRLWVLGIGLAIVLLSCKEEKDRSISINKILVIGNSITIHPPDPSIGRNANWGMAASEADQDYFSLLKDNLQSYFPDLEMIRENVYPFERQFETIDFEQYSHLREFEAEVIIIRLGENIKDAELSNWNLAESIQDFAFYLGTTNTKFIIATTFWPSPNVNEQLRHVASQNHWEFVDISAFGSNPANMAIGQFEDNAVASHPNDQGMLAISKAFSTKILAIEL
ncbi:SGNH/GDSL hydrolase family protein [Cyclobacterium amurskyense]|uniref:SGNH/GDSL hydrolase family protein n=1 Tax=Cyclobacterium amurskyense TaxID=320787 RepID=UPI0030D87C8A|tara:strand:+ start:476 stop:1144 length:669 start_codon:yes stop_codon:yes gene_type:complete